jgi:hypothetical protein
MSCVASGESKKGCTILVSLESYSHYYVVYRRLNGTYTELQETYRNAYNILKVRVFFRLRNNLFY